MSYISAREMGEQMSTEEWITLFRESCLRQYFIDMARSLTRVSDLREDLYQEAWMAVGQGPGGLRLEYYQNIGFLAMGKHRKAWIRWSRKERARAHERVNRIARKYILKGCKRTPL